MEELALLSSPTGEVEFPVKDICINGIPVADLLETYYRAQRRTGVIE